MEWLRLHDGWRLDKPKRHDGLVQWRVVKDTKVFNEIR